MPVEFIKNPACIIEVKTGAHYYPHEVYYLMLNQKRLVKAGVIKQCKELPDYIVKIRDEYKIKYGHHPFLKYDKNIL